MTKFIDVFLVVCGVVYLVKPNIFRRGIWTHTSIMQRNLNPVTYTLVMRILGVFMILAGLYSLLFKR